MSTEPEHQVADLTARVDASRRAAIPRTDYGNAERLVVDHGGDLRFVGGRKGSWYFWDGQRWQRDDTDEVTRRTKSMVRAMLEEAARMPPGDARDALFKFAFASESATRIDAAIKLAASEPSIVARAEDFDADPFLFNLPNGTIDLRTGELREHRREDLLTKIAGVAYDPDAQRSRWLAFLEQALGGDADLIGFLQRAVGYSLTGDTSEQALFLLVGDGANGKTTFVETIAHVHGDYTVHADPATFMTRSGGGPRPDIARLRGRRLVVSSEVEADARFAEVLVKQMTGGEPLVARQLYREEVEFVPTFKVWIAANELPTIRSTGPAIWRRFRRVPFNHKVQRPDKQLPAKLRAEAPGILAWAVEGCLRWQAEGLGVPDAVRVATEDYRASQDTVGAFLRDRCHLAEDAKTAPAALRDAYEGYARAEGIEAVPASAFRAAVEGHGIRQRRTARERWWAGVAVRS
jgi:putative DNA primase/helicase